MNDHKLLEDKETLLVNTCFFDEEDTEYAFKHRFNIKYTEVRNTGFAEDMMMLQNMGYKCELKTEQDVAPDGTKLPDKIYAHFTHPDNMHREGIIYNKNEIKIIVEVLNYLIYLSRLVSPYDALKHFGFNFDGAYIDLFKEIKNKFYYGNLNSPAILNNKIYKQIINELDNMEDEII